tara:strand:+ start:2046 stop:2414 length:369 start_codon:yes stop_codon:yes gene_type:complete
MSFEYNPEWSHHPIPYPDGRISMYDPSQIVPAPEGHPDRGKTGQQVTGADIFTDALIAEYKEKNTWAQMREYRDKLLIESDWTQGDDVPNTIKLPYQTYRQALRDIGSAATTADVVWPTKPS